MSRTAPVMRGLDEVRYALEHISRRPRVGIRDSSGEEFTEIIFAEFMKSAVEIVDYLTAAARRPNASAATVKLAVVLASMWDQSPRTDSRTRPLHPWWMLAFITHRTFIGPDINEVIAIRPYLRGTLDYLARMAADAGNRGGEVERVSAEVSRITQYSGEREASRAKNPWVALENIAYASDTSVPTLEHVDAIEPQMTTALVRLSEVELGLRDPFKDSPRSYEDYMRGSMYPTGTDRTHRDTQPLYAKAVEAEPRIVPVWFGTNRKPAPEPIRPWFGSDAGDPTELHLGRCEVTISDKHKFGSLDKTSWLSRIALGQSGKPMHITRLQQYSQAEQFINDFREQLSKTDDQSILLYIHGYNTTFENAAVRSAQLGFDLGVPGAVALFSWPSAGSLKGYIADQNRADASEPTLEQFLHLLTRKVNPSRLNIIAHSMGNRLFTRVASRLQSYTKEARINLGVVILAAPDVDRRTFLNLAAAFPEISQNTTMYVSTRDKALKASGHLQAFVRAGYSPPVTTLQGIHTIQVGDVDLSMLGLGLGHNYFAKSAAVLYDMGDLLRGGWDPNSRMRLMTATGTNAGQGGARAEPLYWKIRY